MGKAERLAIFGVEVPTVTLLETSACCCGVSTGALSSASSATSCDRDFEEKLFSLPALLLRKAAFGVLLLRGVPSRSVTSLSNVNASFSKC